MSQNVKQRCGIVCNDCHGRSPWRIVDADSEEGQRHLFHRTFNCRRLFGNTDQAINEQLNGTDFEKVDTPYTSPCASCRGQ